MRRTTIWLLVAAVAACDPGETDTSAVSDTDSDADSDGDSDTDTDADSDTDTPIDADGDGSAADVDCDDDEESVHPGATETCNGVDDDCDSEVDEGVLTTWYPDADDDSFGDADAAPVLACAAPTGHVADHTDCDDAVAAAHPGATEVCDQDLTDEDCDGFADDADSSVQGQVFGPVDVDRDGHGDPSKGSVTSCASVIGLPEDDCNDADANAFPGAVELCDGLQDDCTDTAWVSDDGLVTWWDPSGPAQDVTALLPDYVLPTDGEVDFCPGTYRLNATSTGTPGSVDVDCPLGGVTLDGGAVAPVFLLQGLSTRIGACLITNGLGAGVNDTYGGGINLVDGDLELDGTAVRNNVASNGGGVAIGTGASATLRDVDVRSNRADHSGGGVYAFKPSEVRVENSTIALNLGPGGGGISLQLGGTLTVVGGEMTANIGSLGGNLHVVGGEVSIDGTRIRDGNASRGGCIYASDATVTLTGTTVESCIAADDGGAIYLGYGSTLDVGGASRIASSLAASGGGIAAELATVRLHGSSTVTNNFAGDGGGFSALGGDLSVTEGSRIGQNISTRGGGVYLEGSVFDGDGADISGNRASESGGGIWSSHGTIRLHTSNVSSNEASQLGGALYVRGGTVDLQGTTLADDASPAAGVAALSDGAVLTTTDSVVSARQTASPADSAVKVFDSSSYVCMSTGAVPATIQGNVTTVAAVLLVTESGVMDSQGCDWGTSSNGANAPADVYLPSGTTYDADGPATFRCVGSTCP